MTLTAALADLASAERCGNVADPVEQPAGSARPPLAALLQLAVHAITTPLSSRATAQKATERLALRAALAGVSDSDAEHRQAAFNDIESVAELGKSQFFTAAQAMLALSGGPPPPQPCWRGHRDRPRRAKHVRAAAGWMAQRELSATELP